MAKYTRYGNAPEGPEYLVIGISDGSNGTHGYGRLLGYADTLREATEIQDHSRFNNPSVHSPRIYAKVNDAWSQNKGAQNVADITGSGTITDAINQVGPSFEQPMYMAFTDAGQLVAADADYNVVRNAAARRFTDNNGREPVLILTLTEVIKPIVPEVQFTPVMPKALPKP